HASAPHPCGRADLPATLSFSSLWWLLLLLLLLLLLFSCLASTVRQKGACRRMVLSWRKHKQKPHKHARHSIDFI
ncbi:UNVERIFIED_CONTAM: hypothetical protein ODX56_19530, partial [Salmonella enterica subsp. enterica serovar Enteritidis]